MFCPSTCPQALRKQPTAYLVIRIILVMTESGGSFACNKAAGCNDGDCRQKCTGDYKCSEGTYFKDDYCLPCLPGNSCPGGSNGIKLFT